MLRNISLTAVTAAANNSLSRLHSIAAQCCRGKRVGRRVSQKIQYKKQNRISECNSFDLNSVASRSFSRERERAIKRKKERERHTEVVAQIYRDRFTFQSDHVSTTSKQEKVQVSIEIIHNDKCKLNN